MTRPEVLSGETGPQVFHADFNLVTADRPARAGETLMVWVRGLGPSRPDVLPGQPFPQDPLVVANSPVEVLVGGVAVDALNQVGVPGTIDTYRVDFRVPESAALGTTSLQLRAAWIAGNSVNLTVR